MQTKLKIKKGDTVKVIAGAASGQQGVILDVDYKKERVYVEGLSVVNKKHVKPQTDKANPDGGIIEKEASLHVSNVLVLQGGDTSRLGYKILEDGSKVRILKKTNEESEIQ